MLMHRMDGCGRSGDVVDDRGCRGRMGSCPLVIRQEICPERTDAPTIRLSCFTGERNGNPFPVMILRPFAFSFQPSKSASATNQSQNSKRRTKASKKEKKATAEKALRDSFENDQRFGVVSIGSTLRPPAHTREEIRDMLRNTVETAGGVPVQAPTGKTEALIGNRRIENQHGIILVCSFEIVYRPSPCCRRFAGQKAAFGRLGPSRAECNGCRFRS